MANLTIKRGAYQVLTSTIVPASLVSNSTIYFMAKDRVSDSDEDAVISKSLGSGITVTDAPTGIIAIAIEAADTRALPNITTTLKYEIEIEKAGKVYAVDEGTLTVKPEVIQRALA
jgi:nicotinamide mononucleotide (NMN) deamidase PncC